MQKLFAYWNSVGENVSEPSVVAEVIWTAVTDGTSTLRYRAGNDAVELLDNRKTEDDELFIGNMKKQIGLWVSAPILFWINHLNNTHNNIYNGELQQFSNE